MSPTFLSDLTGPSAEFQETATHIQWRIAGRGGPWTNLLPLSDIQGLPGPGATPADTAVVAYMSVLGETATKAALNGTFARRMIAGKPIAVYGHSYAQTPASYVSPGEDWPTRLGLSFGAASNSRAMSGARMIEIATLAIGTSLPSSPSGDRHYPAGSVGPVVIQGVMNDALFGPATSAGILGFKHALRALIATVTAAQRIESSAATVTGSWPTFSAPNMSEGSIRYNSAVGDTMTFENVTAPSGRVWVLTLANSASNPVGTFKVQVNGVDVNLHNGTGQMESFTSVVSGVGQWADFSPAVVAVDVPRTGSHTIKITHTVTPSVYIDALLIPGATPAPVLVCQDPPVGNLTSAGTQAAWAANSPALHAAVAAVAAEFPSASVVNLAPGWTPATMVAASDPSKIHPSAVGMQHIADTIGVAMTTALLAWFGNKVWA